MKLILPLIIACGLSFATEGRAQLQQEKPVPISFTNRGVNGTRVGVTGEKSEVSAGHRKYYLWSSGGYVNLSDDFVSGLPGTRLLQVYTCEANLRFQVRLIRQNDGSTLFIVEDENSGPIASSEEVVLRIPK